VASMATANVAKKAMRHLFVEPPLRNYASVSAGFKTAPAAGEKNYSSWTRLTMTLEWATSVPW